MKSFKHFRNEIYTKYKTKQAGLDNPAGLEPEENEHVIGKELSNVKIPVDVHSELDGPKGNFVLKAKDGKYSLEKEGK